MIKRWLQRLFSGERGNASTIQREQQMLPPPPGMHERAVDAQKAYLEAREKGERDSKALPSNCPIVKMGNYTAEF